MSEHGKDNEEMREEYDFSGGVRGKHYRAYRAGHTVRVTRADGSIEERHFTLEDGAVMLPMLSAKIESWIAAGGG